MYCCKLPFSSSRLFLETVVQGLQSGVSQQGVQELGAPSQIRNNKPDLCHPKTRFVKTRTISCENRICQKKRSAQPNPEVEKPKKYTPNKQILTMEPKNICQEFQKQSAGSRKTSSETLRKTASIRNCSDLLHLHHFFKSRIGSRARFWF